MHVELKEMEHRKVPGQLMEAALLDPYVGSYIGPYKHQVARTVIEVDTVPVGFFTVRNEGDSAHPSLLYILPTHRRTGCAKLAMQTFLNGIPRAHVFINVGNVASTSLFTSLGFQRVGNIRGRAAAAFYRWEYEASQEQSV